MERRAPNMTEFLANLNAPQENADFNDLSLFETTDFLNLDFGETPASNETRSAGTSSAKDAASPEQWMAQPFVSNDIQFSSYNPLVSPTTAPIDSLSTFSLSEFPSQQPSVSQAQLAAAAAASKRKYAELADSSLPPAERARLEAEEDKRRRNTAASARFRVKKKQREQALEKTSKEMTDKANRLEKKLQELELENRWLKGLITEKAAGGSIENLGDMYSKFLASGGEKAKTEVRS